MENNLQENKPSTPGVGVAGKTLCPFTQSVCQKEACELWVELNQSNQMIGRCTYSWKPILQTEIRQEIEKLRNDINAKDTS